MIISRSPFAAGLLAACLMAASALRAEPGHKFKPLTPGEIEAIAAAVPARASVSPAHPRLVLVFYRTEGFVHSSIPYANEALRQLGARTGAYNAEFSDDMSVFTPERLARYDAVIFQNTTGLAFKDPAQRAALLAFVGSGNGFVGIHAASDNFNSWPEAQAMLGGLFHSHPWISMDTVAVKVDDPGNPVVAAFGGHGFWIRDEIYQIVGPYDRAKQRVLLSLDMSRPENARPPEALVRKDADFPIAWLKTYGKGRVFYTSLGHNADIYFTPEILRPYLDGIQFALGDLPASDEPPAGPIAAALAPVYPTATLQDQVYASRLPPDILDRLAIYDFGGDRMPFIALEVYTRAQGVKSYPGIEQILLKLLARPGLLPGAKDYALRMLAAIGSPACVPTLEKFVGDPKFGGTAIYALFEVPGPESGAALLRALASTSGNERLGVINAVARRGLATRMPEPGAQDYLAILNSQASDPARSAALVGLVRTKGRGAIPVLVEELSDHRARVRFEAANLFARVADAAAIARIGPRFSALDSSVQIVLLDALDVRQTPGALGLFLASLTSANPTVRVAAVTGLGGTADAAAIAPLLERLGGDPDESAAAVDSLGRLRAAGVAEALIAAIPAAKPANKAALLRILTARVDHRVYPLAIAAVNDGDAGVRTAAFSAIAATSRAADLPVVLALLPKAGTTAERRSMEHALLEVLRAAPNPDPVVDAISRTLASTQGPARNSLLTALALAGTDDAKASLAGILSSHSAADRREALRAISASKNTHLDLLVFGVAQAPLDAREKILALSDYLDLLQVPDGRSTEQRAQDYVRAWPLADRAQEQDAILAALRNLKTDDAIQIAARLEASRPKS